MLVDRYEPEDVFAQVPEVAQQTDPVLKMLDRLLEDDQLYRQVRTDALAQADDFAQLLHQFHLTVNKGHGRLEIRRHWIIDDPQVIVYLNAQRAWKELRRIGMVQVERRIGQEGRKQTRSYLPSFTRTVTTFAEAVRSHWEGENSVTGSSMWHFVKMTHACE